MKVKIYNLKSEKKVGELEVTSKKQVEDFVKYEKPKNYFYIVEGTLFMTE
jgi:hypothetical protein